MVASRGVARGGGGGGVVVCLCAPPGTRRTRPARSRLWGLLARVVSGRAWRRWPRGAPPTPADSTCSTRSSTPTTTSPATPLCCSPATRDACSASRRYVSCGCIIVVI